ncbi:MAG: MmgE/PrpD family protein, partial [Chloroflexi bacterium]|nr:MmgE/PrpD family protein [Chloroflexota bacterium]
FTEAGLADPAVRAMMPKVTMFVHPEMEPRPGVNPALELVGAEVTLELVDGRSVRHRVRQGKGHPSVPMTEDELADKFYRCAAALPRETRDRIAGAYFRLDRLENMRDLSDWLNSPA